MNFSPGRRKVRGSPRKEVVPDGPIAELTALIEATASEEWKIRVAALEDLVRSIPDGSKYLNGSSWYNTPKTLWHLVQPISELLKDPRSTVVRRVCTALTELFNKCQSDARLLLRDLMPMILQVHAQTVQIIRQAVQTMVTQAIPEVPCKSVMPCWMERLKDKSPAIRDACSLYLGLALKNWTEEGYLTDEIWMQVGTCLLKTMRDPSPTVRKHAKGALQYMRTQHPHRWNSLINDPDGPPAKDPKLMRYLRSLGKNEETVEELSIASKYTFNSESRFNTTTNAAANTTNSNIRISSPRIKPTRSSDDESSNGGKQPVPGSIRVTQKESPPKKPFTHLMNNSPRVAGTPPRPPAAGVSSGSSAQKIPPSPQVQTYSALAAASTKEEDNNVDHSGGEMEYSESNHNEPDLLMEKAAAAIRSTGTPGVDGAFIASMHELKKHASKRRSRNSILMQERFRNMSSSDLGAGSDHSNSNHNGGVGMMSPIMSSPGAAQAPEHIIIAIRLLRAHKAHVDQIMETLKMEMDTLRDFDRLLEEPGRPTEDELLNYYESVDMCLEQRLMAGLELRKEMDRISSGEST